MLKTFTKIVDLTKINSRMHSHTILKLITRVKSLTGRNNNILHLKNSFKIISNGTIIFDFVKNYKNCNISFLSKVIILTFSSFWQSLSLDERFFQWLISAIFFIKIKNQTGVTGIWSWSFMLYCYPNFDSCLFLNNFILLLSYLITLFINACVSTETNPSAVIVRSRLYLPINDRRWEIIG